MTLENTLGLLTMKLSPMALLDFYFWGFCPTGSSFIRQNLKIIFNDYLSLWNWNFFDTSCPFGKYLVLCIKLIFNWHLCCNLPPSWRCNAFSKKQNNGLRIGINGVFGNMGVAAAPLITGFILFYGNWRLCFLLPGVFCILYGLKFLYALKMERAVKQLPKKTWISPSLKTG